MLLGPNANVSSRLIRTQSLELPQLEQYGDVALGLLGIDAAGRLAVEASYRATENATDPDPGDGWLAQFLFDADGVLLEWRDEECGRNLTFEPFSPGGFTPPEAVTPEIEHVFEYTGARWRGLRDTDRIPDVLQPMSIPEKVVAAARGLPGPALGIAESWASCAASIGARNVDGSKLTLICRRLRIAYAVPLQRDTEGLPYDYDTTVLYLGHIIDTDDALSFPPSLVEALPTDVIGIGPMDALFDVHTARLYVADVGDATHRPAIHMLRSTGAA